MKLQGYLLILFISVALNTHSQNFTGRIIDSISQKPIPYATIQTNTKQGVISNEDGFFTIVLEGEKIKNLTFSCMGYSSKTIALAELENNVIIKLNEHINELDTVYINDEKPNIDSIMARVNRNLKINYSKDNKHYAVFRRSTNHMDFEKLDFDIDKASGMRKSKLKNVNYSLDSLANAVKNSRIVSFMDFAGEYYYKDKDTSKLTVNKATLLVDKAKDFSLDNVEKKGKNIILKYLDTTKTYKLKSGLFKVEDSLSLGEELKKDEDEKHQYNVGHLKYEVSSLLNKTFLTENSFLSKLVDIERYEFELEDIVYYQNEFVYKVKFSPYKSKSKYTGTLYISDSDYGILRADYQFAKGKRGEKFNLRLLLGVKYIENYKKGTILFEKVEDHQYIPKYVFQENGRYIYLHRPLKFIENSRDKNKVAFDFLIEGTVRDKHELLIMNYNELTPSVFETAQEKENIPYEYLSEYNPNIWKDYNTIEPVEEMKQFKSVD